MIELSDDSETEECKQLSMQEKRVYQVLKQAFESHCKSYGLYGTPYATKILRFAIALIIAVNTIELQTFK